MTRVLAPRGGTILYEFIVAARAARPRGRYRYRRMRMRRELPLRAASRHRTGYALRRVGVKPPRSSLVVRRTNDLAISCGRCVRCAIAKLLLVRRPTCHRHSDRPMSAWRKVLPITDVHNSCWPATQFLVVT